MITSLVILICLSVFIYCKWQGYDFGEASGWTFVTLVITGLIGMFTAAGLANTIAQDISTRPITVATSSTSQIVFDDRGELLTVNRSNLTYREDCGGEDYIVEKIVTPAWVMGVPLSWNTLYVSCVPLD